MNTEVEIEEFNSRINKFRRFLRLLYIGHHVSDIKIDEQNQLMYYGTELHDCNGFIIGFKSRSGFIYRYDQYAFV